MYHYWYQPTNTNHRAGKIVLTNLCGRRLIRKPLLIRLVGTLFGLIHHQLRDNRQHRSPAKVGDNRKATTHGKCAIGNTDLLGEYRGTQLCDSEPTGYEFTYFDFVVPRKQG